MIKGYHGDELWTVVNPLTGKREIVDPEGKFISGRDNCEAIFTASRSMGVTIPGASLFKVPADTRTFEAVS